MKTVTSIISVAALIGFAVSARAVDPPPDGGYPGGNTAEGDDALFSLTTGFDNTAVGAGALYSNKSAVANTAVGFQALYSNRGSVANTATGYSALYSNTSGRENTATGDGALYYNTTGSFNTATGTSALVSNINGIQNTATGYGALVANNHGDENTASGAFSLEHNTQGNSNTAQGYQALLNNTTGTNNIALGANAGLNLTTGSNNIEIGNEGVAGDSNTIRVGTQGVQTVTHIAGIFGSTVSNGAAVVVGPNGKLGTVTSSARFKDEIKPMDKASEALLALKPVTFHYKSDAKGTPQFGLIAEEVAKVDPDLVVREENGQPYTVRYDAVNAMLLNEFLKEHHKVETQERRAVEQDATLANQQGIIAEQQKEIDALTKGLQRVNEQLSEGRPAGVVNDGPQE